MKYGPSKMIGQRQPRNWPDYHKTWDLDNLFPSVRQSPLSGPFPLLTTLIIIWWFAFMIFSNLPFFFFPPVCVLSHFSHVQPCVTPWTIAHQASLSMGFSRQEYWNGLAGPPSGELPDPEIEPVSFMSFALAGRFFTTQFSSVTLCH